MDRTTNLVSHVTRQRELKKLLRQALDKGDDDSCWAMVEKVGDVKGGASVDVMKQLFHVPCE